MDTSQTLRILAEKRGIFIGAAVAAKPLNQDREYRDLIIREFNIITPENAMKFGVIHPSRDRYNFENVDTITAFSQRHDLKLRGHTLVWHKSLPEWLVRGNCVKADIKTVLREHIEALAGRYRGKIYAWDVVNEPMNPDGALEDSLWLQALGPDYIELAFRWTHEIDPAAKLFLNEWGAETINKKSDAIYKMAEGLLQRNVPLHGIGLQMHVSIGDSEMVEAIPELNLFRENMKRFSDLGLEIHITEMDVQIHGLQGIEEEKLQAQARVYGDILKTALSIPNFKSFIFWGVTDKYSWIPEFMGHPDSPLIFDDSYQPKPAYTAIANVLST